ncbi:hypothetical protein [Marinomonas shanghaiensis]|uniref:hypothetical protein n=1 Tax=Marinomonas shanghaiensis TaxID=2202418 RepID=UPI000DB992BE|nr:hypothetical protein [Marinomonas shanghaiensis]
MYSKSLETFKKDTVNHALKIIKDDGVYRHVSFDDGSSIYAIKIVTWPGYLAVTGDMGEYLFARKNDMFSFFRAKKINPSYWGEKLKAEPNRSQQGKRWTADAFRSCVNDYLKNNLDPIETLDDEEDIEINTEIRGAIDEAIKEIDHEEEANEWVLNFECNDFQLESFYEYDCKEFTEQYLWICHAIIEVIKRYDEIKATEAADQRE